MKTDGKSLDQLDYDYRMGLISENDINEFCKKWNESPRNLSCCGLRDGAIRTYYHEKYQPHMCPAGNLCKGDKVK